MREAPCLAGGERRMGPGWPGQQGQQRGGGRWPACWGRGWGLGPAVGSVPIPVLADVGALAWVAGTGTGRPKSGNDRSGLIGGPKLILGPYALTSRKPWKCLAAVVPLGSPVSPPNVLHRGRGT